MTVANLGRVSARPETLTIDWIREHGGCIGQRLLFTKTFPEGMAWTAANLRRAADAGLDVSWLTYTKLFLVNAWQQETINRATAREWLAWVRSGRETAVTTRREYNAAVAEALILLWHLP